MPGGDIWKQEMSELPYPFPKLAENYYITNSWDEMYNMSKYYVLEKDSFFYYIIYRVISGSCKIVGA